MVLSFLPVYTCVAKCAWNVGYMPQGGILFRGCTSGGVYIPSTYTHARWVTVGNSGLCCCTCVTYFERWLTPHVLILQLELQPSALCVPSFLPRAVRNNTTAVTTDHFNKDAAQTPDVHSHEVVAAAQQYLWRSVPQRYHLKHNTYSLSEGQVKRNTSLKVQGLFPRNVQIPRVYSSRSVCVCVCVNLW